MPVCECFGQCMMPKDCARAAGAMDVHGSGCVGRVGLIRRKTMVEAGVATDPEHGLGVGMAIVWHGWVASIVGCTAIYNMVGATCVGVMLL